MNEIPDWTFKGGSFRSGYGTNDIPSRWYKKKGRWRRDEIVPFGKATDDYRVKYYCCPECEDGKLLPEPERRVFGCERCGLLFSTFFGSLTEREDENRFILDNI